MKTKLCRFIVLSFMVAGHMASIAGVQAASRIMNLVKESDFIGFVQADPTGSVNYPEQGQFVYIYDADPLKGSLKHDYGNGFQYPIMQTNSVSRAGYPTWFGEKGEYLVFCRTAASDSDTSARLLTLAAYPVTYQPNAAGVITGTLFGGKGIFALSRDRSRSLLAEVITGSITLSSEAEKSASILDAVNIFILDTNLYEAANELDSQISAVDVPPLHSQSYRVPTYDERLAEAIRVVTLIRPGTSREQVEKMFTQSDGGCQIPTVWRYYFGSEVMISVPYDNTGGCFMLKNRVNGSLTVYRSSMHYD